MANSLKTDTNTKITEEWWNNIVGFVGGNVQLSEIQRHTFKNLILEKKPIIDFHTDDDSEVVRKTINYISNTKDHISNTIDNISPVRYT